jgi:Na+/H+ antiporter NhaC
VPAVATFLFALLPAQEEARRFEIEFVRRGAAARVCLIGFPLDVSIRCVDAEGATVPFDGRVRVTGVEGVLPEEGVELSRGRALLKGVRLTSGEVSVADASTARIRMLPGFLSLLPPILAIALLFAVRHSVFAFLAGIWGGMIFLAGLFPSFPRTFDTAILGAIVAPEHASILLFVLSVGGLVAVLQKSGGSHALADALWKFVESRRLAQGLAALAGALFFFEPRAGCLWSGAAVRPLSDRLRVSRAKLAFLIDSTASPVAMLAVLSTFAALQIEAIGGGPAARDVYLRALPFAFYPAFALAMVAAVVILQRDFGPMKRSEQSALSTGKLTWQRAQPLLDPDVTLMASAEGRPHYWFNSVVPLAALFLFFAAALLIEGFRTAPVGGGLGGALLAGARGEPLGRALIWSGFGAALVAIGMATFTRSLSLEEAVETWVRGVRGAARGALLLILAWALVGVCEGLDTGAYLARFVGTSLPPAVFPAALFAAAALASFATGSAVSTSAVMIALALSADESTRHISVAAILSGSLLGDHLSPYAPTTLFAAAGAGCGLTEHFYTQLPYGLAAAAAALFLGFLPAGLGIPPAFSFAVGAVALVGVTLLAGQRLAAPPPGTGATAFVSEEKTDSFPAM